MIQQMLAIWSLVPVAFPKPAWTSGSSEFMLLKPGWENFKHYFTSVWDECNCVVVWAFFGIAVLGLEWKLTFSSLVASAVLSKFAGILSTALSWHHLFSSVRFSRSVMFNYLQNHESQHAKPPCPSLTARVHSDSCPSSQWWHPAISSSVDSFSSCP